MCVLGRTLSQKPLKPFLGQYKTKKPIEKLILEKNRTSKTPLKIGFCILDVILGAKFRNFGALRISGALRILKILNSNIIRVISVEEFLKYFKRLSF